MKVVKNYLNVLALVALGTFVQGVQAREKLRVDTLKARKICTDELNVKAGCKACRTITKKDFFDEESQTYSKTVVISEPGKYCLGESVDFEAAFPGQEAIHILSNSVILDLCDNRLTHVNKEVFDVVGVRLGFAFDLFAVFNNITVRNGTLLDFSGQGIGALCVAVAVTGDAFQDITIENINTLNCGSNETFFYASGIDLDSFADLVPGTEDLQIAFRNVTIKNCNANNCLGNGAIEVFTGDGVRIEHTQANNLSSTEDLLSAGVHAYAVYCDNLCLDSVQGNDSRARGNASFTAGGVLSLFSKNVKIINSQFNGAVGETTQSAGNRLDNINGLIVENTQFNNTQSLSPAGGDNNQISGLFSQRGRNQYFLNCQFCNTFGESNSIVQGVNCSNTFNVVYENCLFNDSVGGETAGIVGGIHMSDSDFQTVQGNGMKWLNCQFNDARSRSRNAGEFIYGFIAITLRNISFESCEAINIADTGEEPTSVYGFFTITLLSDVTPEAGNVRNVSYLNCTARDIFSRKDAVGFYVGGSADLPIVPELGVGQSTNNTLKGCIAERIYSSSAVDKAAGIHEGFFIDDENQPATSLVNFFVKDCRVSDVRSNFGGEVSPLSAGILVQSVQNPVICENSVSDCDRGILLTGTNDLMPNGFRLATSSENALAQPPQFIDLDTAITVSVPGLEPFFAAYPIQGKRITSPIVYPGELADPTDACTPLVNDLTDKIGIVLNENDDCVSMDFVLNVEAARAEATLIVDGLDNLFNYGGNDDQTKVAVVITQEDGEALLQVLADNPEALITIDSVPTSAITQLFTNERTEGVVPVSPGQVDPVSDFVLPSADVSEWQTGDPVIYDPNGGKLIPPLDPANNPYYAVVYSPGFSESGLIQDNKVDNCTISGYQDDRTPTTSSGWFNNTAFLNGPDHESNYAITWANESNSAQVDKGTLGNYPASTNKYFNLSIKPNEG